MSTQTDLQSLLDSIPGVTKAYFQPPESIELTYPCIIYERSRLIPKYADNNPYNITKMYTITVIDKSPEGLISDQVALLPGVIFDRYYKVDNLNHDVFTIHYS